MKAYTGFAEVYDLFMDNVPYDEWCLYITGILKKQGINDGLLLELGCGTGEMTRRLEAAGYDMTGVDLSADMLGIAREKSKEDEHILYLCQDMREFELYGTVRAIVSVCDSMNYILSGEEMLKVFKLVNNYLDPGGLFIFDMNTFYKYRELLGENTICENREEGSFIWENYFDEETGINEYDMTFFIKEDSGLYRKYQETHYQKAYEVEEVIELIKKAGMEFVAVYGEGTDRLPGKDCERIYFIAKEQGKCRNHVSQ